MSFLTFPACFYIPIIFSNLKSNCSNLSYLRNLQEQVKKAFCYKNCSDLSPFEWILQFCKFSAFSLKFQKLSRSLEQFFLSVGQNNFGNKIPLLNSNRNLMNTEKILSQTKMSSFQPVTSQPFYLSAHPADPHWFKTEFMIQNTYGSK